MKSEESQKVDQYIKKQKAPQKEICTKLRKIILKTFPKIKEGFENGVPWYGKYYFVALKDKVNLGFCINGLTKKELELFEGNGKLMRHIKIFDSKELDEKHITKLLKITQKCKEIH